MTGTLEFIFLIPEHQKVISTWLTSWNGFLFLGTELLKKKYILLDINRNTQNVSILYHVQGYEILNNIGQEFKIEH